MAGKMVRTALALAVMASTVTMPTVAAAETVRPGQSVVSAERAATSTNLFQAQQQQRAGAEMKDANQANPLFMKWLVLFLASIPVGWAFYKAVLSP